MSSSRDSTDDLETIRFDPSRQDSSFPDLHSWATRARLTPSFRAASAAVIAGMSDRSRETATAMTLPPWRAGCPNDMGASLPRL